LRDTIGEIGIPKLRKSVVADVQHPAGDVGRAGHGEVPGHIEAFPGDAGVTERREDVLEMLATGLDYRVLGDFALGPVKLEAIRRVDRGAVSPLLRLLFDVHDAALIERLDRVHLPPVKATFRRRKR